MVPRVPDVRDPRPVVVQNEVHVLQDLVLGVAGEFPGGEVAVVDVAGGLIWSWVDMVLDCE